MVPPGASVTLPDVHARVDANTDRAADLERSLLALIDERIAAATGPASDLANHLLGAVAAKLAANNERAQGLVSKIYKAMDKQLGNTMVPAFPLGYVYPTLEEAYARVVAAPNAPISYLAGPVAAPVGTSDTIGLPTAGGPVAPVVPLSPPVAEPPPAAPPPPPSPPIAPSLPPSRPPVAFPPPALPPGGPPGGPPWGCPPCQGGGGAGGEAPPGGPGPGPSGGPPGGPPVPPVVNPCPPGFHQASADELPTVPVGTPISTGLPGFGPRPVQMAPGSCPPIINPNSLGQPFTPFQGQPGGVEAGPAWSMPEDDTPITGVTKVCIDPCHWPAGWGGSSCVAFWSGLTLCINPQTGDILSSTVCPSGFQPLTDVSGQPVGGPGQPPAPCKPVVCVPDKPPPDQCFVPEVAQCGPGGNGAAGGGGGGQFAKLDLANDAVCQAISKSLDQVKGQNASVADWIGMNVGNVGGDSTWATIAKALLGAGNPVLPDLVNRFAKWLQGFLTKGTNATGCDQATLLPIVINAAVLRLIDRWTDAVPKQLITSLEQMSNTACQSKLPTGAEADAAYLADQIDQGLWECYQKAAGHHLQDFTAIRDAKRERPNFTQARKLFVRNLIDQPRFDKLARAAGVTDDTDKQNLSDYENYFPAVAEIFRWQQEQLYNEDVIARFELDQDWDQVYAQNIKDRADGHQMKESDARRHYMSMWKRPGYSEMVEMVRRLRPDRVDADLVFTEDDLNVALKQEGHPDYFIKRLAKLREHQPTRRDVHSLYLNHVIDEEEVKRQWQDQGFASDFADMQTEQLKIERQLADYHRAGYPAPGTLASLYGRGELSRSEFQALAEKVAFYDGQIDEMTDAADVQMRIENKRLALQGVKAQFIQGLLDPSGVHAALAEAGLDGDQIDQVTQYWDRIKKSTPKEVGASTLCQWRKDHLIGAFDQAAALRRLGYRETDVDLIVKDCTYKMAVAAEKAEQAALKAAQAAANKAAKAQCKAGKKGTTAGSSTPGP